MPQTDNHQHLRARDVGFLIAGLPGPLNAITDVEGVTVGHVTLIRGDGQLKVGQGPVRTGVTVVRPRGDSHHPVFAGWYALNGNGEMTGTTWIEESGFLEGPIGLTNTHSVGVVRDSIIAWQVNRNLVDPTRPSMAWSLPVVAETWDGVLNDINGQHITAQHVYQALESSRGGPVAEGTVGAGTGMICHGFKGGIGTASRRLSEADGGYSVGVLVQANHGRQRDLTICGVPVGQHLHTPGVITDAPVLPGAGSIIVVVATDAALLPHQLKRIARRVPLGLARVGSYGSHSSGDIFLAFSTANEDAADAAGAVHVSMLPNAQMNPLFDATIQATEEAILNALVAATPVTGINGNRAEALPIERIQALLQSTS